MSGLLLAWSSVWNTVLLFPDCFWSSEWCVWFSAAPSVVCTCFLKLEYFTMWPPWGENQISPVQPRSSSTRTGSKFKSVAAGRINFIVRPVLQESSTCFGLGRPAKQWFIALHVLFMLDSTAFCFVRNISSSLICFKQPTVSFPNATIFSCCRHLKLSHLKGLMSSSLLRSNTLGQELRHPAAKSGFNVHLSCVQMWERQSRFCFEQSV